jgi:hypothetical protein
VIVALALRATEDVGDYAETGKASRGFLAESIDLLLRRLLVLVDVDSRLVSLLCVLDRRSGIVGSDEALTGLVGVQDTSLLLVGSVDVVDTCKVLYTEEGVEGSIASFVLGNLILETENFVVCQLSCQYGCRGGRSRQENSPSGDQAQTRATKHKSKSRIEPWRRAMIAVVMSKYRAAKKCDVAAAAAEVPGLVSPDQVVSRPNWVLEYARIM